MVSFLVCYVKRKGWETFGEGEIVKVILDLKGDIAPKPDGFALILYQKDGKFCSDFGIYINEYFRSKLRLSSNSTFIMLLVKKQSPSNELQSMYKDNCKGLIKQIKWRFIE